MKSNFLLILCLTLTKSAFFRELGRWYDPTATGPDGSIETVTVDPKAQKVWGSNGGGLAADVFRYEFDRNNSNAATIERTAQVVLTDYNCSACIYNNGTAENEPTDIYRDASRNIVWVAADNKIDPGRIFAIDGDTNEILTELKIDDLCYMPDMIHVSYDYKYAGVACEGEPLDYNSANPVPNPPGGIVIIDLETGPNYEWTFLDFTAYNDIPDDVCKKMYVNQSFAVDAEPEYVTFNYDSTLLYVVLQENNCMVTVDLTTKTIAKIQSVGYEYYKKIGIDASDKDGKDGTTKLKLRNYNVLYGLRQPDSIYYWESKNGSQYVLCANEGDNRPFDRVRVSNISKSKVSSKIRSYQDEAKLGRLYVDKFSGYSTESGKYEELYYFGGRSFTVHNATDMSTVFSSENFMTQWVGENNYEFHNAEKDEFPSFDKRSDNRGHEPEALALGKCYCNNNEYDIVVVSLEQSGGMMAFDITEIDDGEVDFVGYFNNRPTDVSYEDGERPPYEAGDIDLEEIMWINANDSSIGVPYVVCSGAVSGSMLIAEVDCCAMDENRTKVSKYDPYKVNGKNSSFSGGNSNNNLSPVAIVFIVLGCVAVVLVIGYYLWQKNRKTAGGSEESQVLMSESQKQTRYN